MGRARSAPLTPPERPPRGAVCCPGWPHAVVPHPGGHEGGQTLFIGTPGQGDHSRRRRPRPRRPAIGAGKARNRPKVASGTPQKGDFHANWALFGPKPLTETPILVLVLVEGVFDGRGNGPQQLAGASGRPGGSNPPGAAFDSLTLCPCVRGVLGSTTGFHPVGRGSCPRGRSNPRIRGVLGSTAPCQGAGRGSYPRGCSRSARSTQRTRLHPHLQAS